MAKASIRINRRSIRFEIGQSITPRGSANLICQAIIVRVVLTMIYSGFERGNSRGLFRMWRCLITGMVWSGTVRVQVLFFPVRVVPSGPAFNFRFGSGLKTKSSPGFRLWAGFHFFPVRSGPVRVSFSICFIYKLSFSSELSIGSVLEL